MYKNRVILVLSVLVVASMVLAACAPAETPAPTQPPAAPTQPPQAPPTPTPEPVVRNGAWVDEIVFSEQGDDALCIAQLQAGDLDICADGNTNADDFKTVQGDPNLTYANSFGLNFGLLFNPIPQFNDGRVNPFGVAKIREAVNMLVDRKYVVQEIFAGLGLPKYSPLVGVFPDYVRHIDAARSLEAKYAYNPEKAAEIINAEMEKLGATKDANGKWQLNGQPVTLIFIIRVEWGQGFGNYVANQLESLGFTVDRQYKVRAEASPIWLRSDPFEGQWNLYTEGWINTAISRDDGTSFGFYYTDFGGCCGLSTNYLTADVVGQEFYDVAKKLWNNDFTTIEERAELFKKALLLSSEFAYHVWLIDTQAFFPYRKEVSVAADLAGGISGSRLYPHTVRFVGKEGGTVRIALSDNFIDPWNPIGGSNWISDQMVIRATDDVASMPDPYTGLAWPQRAAKLEVTAKTGLPIAKTLDWVDLKFADTIEVPADAWVDWDAEAQTFIPAGAGKTANVKVTWTYPADMFEKVKWHDGSPLSPADFVIAMILTFDRAKEASAIYDASYVPDFEAFVASFRGVKIESTNPLVISTYSDAYALDAETFGGSWWPNYAYGQAGWHNLTPAILAEAAGEVAFTNDKATEKGVEWTNMIDGPTLEIQKKYLDQALAEGYIPYAPTLGNYITVDEAKARYENLSKWYADHGHFWVGTGPFYLDRVFTTEGNAVLKRNEAYPDPADKWARFAEPRIPVVDLSGDGQVVAGQEANYEVLVTFADEPYAAADLESVKYLVFDSASNLVASGQAEFVADGQYTFSLGADLTGGFEAGAYRLEVAVVSKLVSIPGFASLDIVVVK